MVLNGGDITSAHVYLLCTLYPIARCISPMHHHHTYTHTVVAPVISVSKLCRQFANAIISQPQQNFESVEKVTRYTASHLRSQV